MYWEDKIICHSTIHSWVQNMITYIKHHHILRWHSLRLQTPSFHSSRLRLDIYKTSSHWGGLRIFLRPLLVTISHHNIEAGFEISPHWHSLQSSSWHHRTSPPPGGQTDTSDLHMENNLWTLLNESEKRRFEPKIFRIRPKIHMTNIVSLFKEVYEGENRVSSYSSLAFLKLFFYFSLVIITRQGTHPDLIVTVCIVAWHSRPQKQWSVFHSLTRNSRMTSFWPWRTPDTPDLSKLRVLSLSSTCSCPDTPGARTGPWARRRGRQGPESGLQCICRWNERRWSQSESMIKSNRMVAK